MEIIIRNKGTTIGKVRSEQEGNLRKEWGGTLNDGQLDKLKYLERKSKEKLGSQHNFIGQENIDDGK